MAYLTPEKEVDLMLEFSRIKTELIDLGENESDYPTLSIAEVKQIEKYKQVRVAVANVLDLHKGKAFHPKNAINEPYIENVAPHLTEERLEQIINYIWQVEIITDKWEQVAQIPTLIQHFQRHCQIYHMFHAVIIIL